MDIRKADSKGRITGFLPGQHYAFDWEKGYVAKIAVHAPDGRPIADAIEQDIGMHQQAYVDMRGV